MILCLCGASTAKSMETLKKKKKKRQIWLLGKHVFCSLTCNTVFWCVSLHRSGDTLQPTAISHSKEESIILIFARRKEVEKKWGEKKEQMEASVFSPMTPRHTHKYFSLSQFNRKSTLSLTPYSFAYLNPHSLLGLCPGILAHKARPSGMRNYHNELPPITYGMQPHNFACSSAFI